MTQELTLNAIKTVGFIGTGNMGSPMVRQLQAAGYSLLIYDADREKCAALAAEPNIDIADDPGQIGSQADVVITMLPTSKIVGDVILGENGVASGLRPNSIVIDMSTSLPEDTIKLGEALAKRNVHVVDAPVAGGVVFAVDGSLDILVGGHEEVAAHIDPLLQAMGKQTTYCGKLGTAHAMKSINNTVNAAVLCIYLEALELGKKVGIDQDTVLSSLEAATLDRNHPFDKKIKKQILTEKFGTGMAMGLIAKDIQIAISTADHVDQNVPVSRLVGDIWKEGADKFGFNLDQTEIYKYWR